MAKNWVNAWKLKLKYIQLLVDISLLGKYRKIVCFKWNIYNLSKYLFDEFPEEIKKQKKNLYLLDVSGKKPC